MLTKLSMSKQETATTDTREGDGVGIHIRAILLVPTPHSSLPLVSIAEYVALVHAGSSQPTHVYLRPSSRGRGRGAAALACWCAQTAVSSRSLASINGMEPVLQ